MMSTKAISHILLVDDDKHLLTTLGDFLGFEGFRVSRAESAEAALDFMQKETPDLVVLDIGMPGMGGLGFLRQVTDSNGGLRCPVLVLTARASMEPFIDSVEVDGFLAKPCSGVDLVREIRTILTRWSLKSEARSRVLGRILLVENHAATAERLADAFRVAGYEVDIVHHGLEIFRQAAVERPDVIVTKEILPTMKGSAVALMVKGHSATRSIPFVLYDASHLLEAHAKRGDPAPRSVDAVVLTDDAESLMDAINGVLGAARQ